LIYPQRATYRSHATVVVGHPISVAGSMGDEENRGAVVELTASISDALAHVAPSWESWDSFTSAHVAARFVAAANKEQELGAVLTRLNMRADERPDAMDELAAAVHRLEDECEHLGIDLETFIEQPGAGVAKLGIKTAVVTSLWIVPAVVGRLLNLVPFVVVGGLSRTQNLDFQATFKVLVGVVLFPVWWVVLGMLAHWRYGQPWGWVAVLASILLGYVSAQRFYRIRRSNNATKLFELAGKKEQSQLADLRSEVIAQADALLAHQELRQTPLRK